MKLHLSLVNCICISTTTLFVNGVVHAQAQTLGTVATAPGQLSVVEAGPNYRICDDTNASAALGQQALNGTAQGVPRQRIHNRVELATGMNYWNPASGAYETSQPAFAISPDGTAFVADKVQHKLRLNGQIYGQAALTINFESTELRCSPAAIGIYNAADGTSAVIGTLTNSTGIQIATNQIVFDDAFAGVCVSEVYTVEAGTVHQDTVFTGKLDPTAWGFSTNDPLRIQIFTEFFGQPPQPDVLEQPVYVEGSEAIRSRLVSPDLMDQTIGFGNLVFGTGRAYTMPTQNDPAGTGVVVAKEFVTTADGRNFLVETVDFKFIQQLLSLPDCALPSGSARVIRKGDAQSLYASIPQPARASQAKTVANNRKLAQAHTRPKGVRIDWIANVGGSLYTPFVFAADTNWFVNGAFYCNAAATFEGGTVLKYPTNTAWVSLGSTVTLKSLSFRPVICTAVDDDSVGDSFTNWPGANYTGVINPNGYANPALVTSLTTLTLSNFRFCYAKEAILYDSPSPYTFATLTVSHSQFVNCIRGIELDQGGTGTGTGVIALNVNNSLMTGVQNPVYGGSPGNPVNLALVHCTVLTTIS